MTYCQNTDEAGYTPIADLLAPLDDRIKKLEGQVQYLQQTVLLLARLLRVEPANGGSR